jgi:hypothetical protein
VEMIVNYQYMSDDNLKELKSLNKKEKACEIFEKINE